MMNKITLYIKETWHELVHKVTWPTLEELQSSTIIVLVASAITSLSVFAMDFAFGMNPENRFFEGILYYVYQLFN